jgi:L-methionine (R)-S-oxide reductase
MKSSLPTAPIGYPELRAEVSAMVESDWLPTLCNIAACLKMHLHDVNWVGFYLFRDGELVLGPFQGLPACTRIALGRGVCGKAALERRTLLVDDVLCFADHIACDSASRSELVIPLALGDRLLGVLDLDSPLHARFSEEDRMELEKIARILAEGVRWPEFPLR